MKRAGSVQQLPPPPRAKSGLSPPPPEKGCPAPPKSALPAIVPKSSSGTIHVHRPPPLPTWVSEAGQLVRASPPSAQLLPLAPSKGTSVARSRSVSMERSPPLLQAPGPVQCGPPSPSQLLVPLAGPYGACPLPEGPAPLRRGDRARTLDPPAKKALLPADTPFAGATVTLSSPEPIRLHGSVSLACTSLKTGHSPASAAPTPPPKPPSQDPPPSTPPQPRPSSVESRLASARNHRRGETPPASVRGMGSPVSGQANRRVSFSHRPATSSAFVSQLSAIPGAAFTASLAPPAVSARSMSGAFPGTDSPNPQSRQPSGTTPRGGPTTDTGPHEPAPIAAILSGSTDSEVSPPPATLPPRAASIQPHVYAVYCYWYRFRYVCCCYQVAPGLPTVLISDDDSLDLPVGPASQQGEQGPSFGDYGKSSSLPPYPTCPLWAVQGATSALPAPSVAGPSFGSCSEVTATDDEDAPLAYGGRAMSFFAPARSGDPKALRVFQALDLDGDGSVQSAFLVTLLARSGLHRGDPRLAGLFGCLDKMGPEDADVALTPDDFEVAIQGCMGLVHRCVSGHLKVPDFPSFAEVLEYVYEAASPNAGGNTADYIPELAKVDPEQFSVSVCTVDGQRHDIGDFGVPFSLQSCTKPISYLIALRQFGGRYVHSHVGHEPSGVAFNQIILKDTPGKGSQQDGPKSIPHNPMINAGAIMAVSMVYPEQAIGERLTKVMDVWRDLAGSEIGYDGSTYRCLAYMMKDQGAFPPCCSDMGQTLELYFKICSCTTTGSQMAIVAATRANGGLNPVTGDRVFTPHQLPCIPSLCIPISGQWAYDVGIPAKSGVGGCVFLVIPNVCGISFWSPRLDGLGNSVRAVHAAMELVNRVSFPIFEVCSGLSQTKLDVTTPKGSEGQVSDARLPGPPTPLPCALGTAVTAAIASLLYSASVGDLAAVRQAAQSDVNLFATDYDQRSALHLAAGEGHLELVQFIVRVVPKDLRKELVNVRDRWGGTPLDDADRSRHPLTAKLLRKAGAQPGASIVRQGSGPAFDDAAPRESEDAPRALWAAFNGDLFELIALAAKGADLSSCDYDRRTALHLACCSGHTDAVTYLLAQSGMKHLHRGEKSGSHDTAHGGSTIDSCGNVGLPNASNHHVARKVVIAQDRWGNTGLDDCYREGYPACAKLLAETY
eukprot:gene3564-671_t